ncbi:hypothetical protein J8273_6306 [Carpediemonas membranifera]|uniref:Uncharacterized protein n=1 Tax=Carpediemonas membranifera TaxID=201153 RepID=A0A8J6B7D7_9EUKA|nr:hypothetical protein J8273_6306 [Carpediemonas membranifera]|eukprot:KAG9391542.1 hypothetical protein J8273_6306 [Carpediemonas membranifera]
MAPWNRRDRCTEQKVNKIAFVVLSEWSDLSGITIKWSTISEEDAANGKIIADHSFMGCHVESSMSVQMSSDAFDPSNQEKVTYANVPRSAQGAAVPGFLTSVQSFNLTVAGKTKLYMCISCQFQVNEIFHALAVVCPVTPTIRHIVAPIQTVMLDKAMYIQHAIAENIKKAPKRGPKSAPLDQSLKDRLERLLLDLRTVTKVNQTLPEPSDLSPIPPDLDEKFFNRAVTAFVKCRFSAILFVSNKRREPIAHYLQSLFVHLSPRPEPHANVIDQVIDYTPGLTSCIFTQYYPDLKREIVQLFMTNPYQVAFIDVDRGTAFTPQFADDCTDEAARLSYLKDHHSLTDKSINRTQTGVSNMAAGLYHSLKTARPTLQDSVAKRWTCLILHNATRAESLERVKQIKAEEDRLMTVGAALAMSVRPSLLDLDFTLTYKTRVRIAFNSDMAI